MSNLTTTIPTVIKYVSQVASFPLRWYYTVPKLDQFLKLDISGCGIGIDYNFHSQEAQCWLTAYNLSPFLYTIDRLTVDVCFNGGATFSCATTMPNSLEGMSDKKLYVHGKSPMTLEVARASKESKEAWASINAYVITSMRKFEIRRHLQNIANVRLNA